MQSACFAAVGRMRRRLAAALVVAGLLAPSAAFAEPSAADRETARTLMKQGDTKAASKDFAGALKDYQAAHAIMQVPSTGLSLAKTQIELGLLVEARDTLLGIARLPKPVVEAPPLAKAREEAGPLAQKLAERIPSLSISIDGPPAGSAQVTVDGAAVLPDTLGTPRKVNPGQHTVVAAAQGFQNATRTVTVKEGETAQVAIRLIPGAGGAPIAEMPKETPGGGHIHVISPVEPGNVIVDGKAVGATPLDVPVKPGSHVVEVEYPGGSHEERHVEVGANGRVEVEVKPSATDALARYRRGPHFGVMFGPSMETFIGLGGNNLFGLTAGPVLNIGITPVFEFETGVTPSFHYHHEGGSPSSTQVIAAVPALLRAHLAPWFMASAGITGGAALNFGNLGQAGKLHVDYVVGPEWQLLMVGGGKREFEVGVEQGFHFGSGPIDFHQMVNFTYLFLD